MKRLKSIVLIVSAIVMSVSYLLVTETPSVDAQGSAALSIVPRKNYTIEPGKSIRDTLLIRNLDSQIPLNLSLRIVDFTFTDDGGTPKLMLAEDAPQTTWSLKPFLKIPQNVTIEPGSSKTINLSVSIPKNQGAGSYYSAIVYSSGSSEGGGNVGLSASGVTLAFTTIPGEVKEELLIKSLGAYDPEAKKYRFFNTDEPAKIAYTLENKGNVAESPVGSITLRSLFGQETTITNINPNQSLALIGQTRTFEACIKLKKEEVDFNGSRSEATTCSSSQLWPGYYSVELNGFYGQNGNNTKDLVGKGGFWYLPLWFIIVLLVVLAFLGYHAWKIVRYIRRKRGTASKPRASRQK